MEKKVKKEKSKLRKIIEDIFTGLFVVAIGFSAFLMISSTVAKKKSENPNAPTLVGNTYMPLIVLTQSMEPEIPQDSAIFIKKIEPEQIVEKFENNETCDLAFYDSFAYGVDLSDEYTPETKTLLATHSVNGSSYHKTIRTTQSDPAPVGTLTHRLFHVQVNEDVAEGAGKYFFFVEGININANSYSDANQYQVFTELQLYGIVKRCSVFIGKVFSFFQSAIGLIFLLLVPSIYMIVSSFIDLFKKEEEKEAAMAAETNNGDVLNGLSKKEIEKLKEEMLNDLMGNKGDKK